MGSGQRNRVGSWNVAPLHSHAPFRANLKWTSGAGHYPGTGVPVHRWQAHPRRRALHAAGPENPPRESRPVEDHVWRDHTRFVGRYVSVRTMPEIRLMLKV
eukprot:791789-Rhodomonas_salina.1